MNEQSGGRFLRYAIGEVLLVVIGILIALQINNWKEQQVAKKQEAYYVQRLLDEFEFNNVEATRSIGFSKFQRDNAELLLKSIAKTLTDAEQQDWLYALTHTWWLPHTNYNETTWSELKTTGKLDLVSNRELIKAISSFYSNVAYVTQLENEWGGFNLRYRELVNNILEDDLRVKVMAGIGHVKIERSLDQLIDANSSIEELREIPGIQGLIRDIQINREVGTKLHEDLKAEIGQVVELLRDETG